MRAVFLTLAMALSACFSPDQPLCTFTCGENGACPDDYECRADNFCHLKGSVGECPYPDAAVSIQPDLASRDLSADFSSSDASNSD